MCNLLFSLVVLLLLNQSTADQVKTNSLSFNLIHRDSILSPFYNQSMTSSDLLRKAVEGSLARVNYLNSTSINLQQKDFESRVVPSEGSYLMEIAIGSQEVWVHATIDTRTDFTWVQCIPFKGVHLQDKARYNPKQSDFYKTHPYGTRFCNSIKGNTPGEPKKPGDPKVCDYDYVYGDGSNIQGTLSEDKFHIDSTNLQEKFSHTLVFGCSSQSQGNFKRPSQGMIGLGKGILSFISQLGTHIENRFSYCFQPKTVIRSSRLKFGIGARIPAGDNVVSTPLELVEDSKYYFVLLKGVSINNNENFIDDGILMAIDSTSTVTHLHTKLYEYVEENIRLAVDVQPIDDHTGLFNLCYPSSSISIEQLPGLALYFGGKKSKISLKSTNLFEKYHEMLCLLIFRNDGTTRLGNVAQVNFQVEFDLNRDKPKVSFAPATCEEAES